MNNTRTIYLLILLIFISMLFLFTGCDSGDRTYSIKGRVELIPLEKYGIEVPRDFANVTVLAYRTVAIDPVMADLNASHPNHGVVFDQSVVFDHRLGIPHATTQTAADGQFTIKKLSEGRYNIVAYREDWGFKYLLDVNVQDDINGLTIHVPPVIDLPLQLSSDYQMIDGVVYRATSDMIVLPDQKLSAHGNHTIMLAPNSSLSIYGGINVIDNATVRFMSSDKTYSHSQTEVGRFNQINIVGISDQILQGLRIRDSMYGIRVTNCGRISILNSVFEGFYQSLILSNTQNINISKCVFSKSTDSSLGALYGEFVQNITIERSVFYDNAIGMTLTGCNPGLVKNNYFKNNSERDVHSGTSSVTTIEYNAFPNSITAITNFAGTIEAYYNDITAVTGIHSYQNAATFTARYNNLDCTEYGIISKGTFGGTGIREMIATNNFWFTTSASEIEQKIYDRNDEDPQNPNYDLLKTVVIYRPYAHNRISAAGLRN